MLAGKFDAFDAHAERFVEIITTFVRVEFGEPDLVWIAQAEEANREKHRQHGYAIVGRPRTESEVDFDMDEFRPSWSYDDFKRAALQPGAAKGVPRKDRVASPRKLGHSQAVRYLEWFGIDRDQIVSGDPEPFAVVKWSAWPYYGAALARMVERARSTSMNCMSCQNPLTQENIRIFNTIVVCSQCHGLATKAEREVTTHFERARKFAMNWLEQHILKGGLLQGGSGYGAAQAGGLQVHVPAPVQELQDPEGAEAAGVPVSDRERSPD